MLKRSLTILLIFLFFGFTINNTIATSDNDNNRINNEQSEIEEQKVINKATLDDEFCDSSVIVMLKNNVSRQLRTFSERDFSDLNVIDVSDLTRYSVAAIKKQRTEDSEEIDSSVQRQQTETFNSKEGFRINENSFNQSLKLEIKETGKENVLKTIKALEKRDDILYAGPNYITRIVSTPNDPQFSNQWALQANRMNAPGAWGITTGSASVNVAVMDTGINSNHPDLNNRVNATLSRDFTGNNAPLVDPNGHGTHVAGVIGARGNNGIGIAGICWDVSLVSLRVFDSSGYGFTSWVTLATDYASVSNIPVVNYSGGHNSSPNSIDVANKNAIANYPGVFVGAAGNGLFNNGIGIDNDNHATPFYPASYGLSNIISVGNSTSNDTRSSSSNFGQNSVHVFAPGTNILSTMYNSSYESLSGTSMAAPQVAGVAALIRNVRPDFTAAQIKHVIFQGVDKISAFNNFCTTDGRLNAKKALDFAMAYGHFATSEGWFSMDENQRVWAADINGDGRDDIVAIGYDGQVRYSLANADGTYGTRAIASGVNFPVAHNWFSTNGRNRVFPTDVNGDGYVDFVGISIAGEAFVYLNNENNGFHPLVNSFVNFPTNHDWFNMANNQRVWMADINGNGRDDIVAIDSNGQVRYALANTNGTFGTHTISSGANFPTAHGWFSTTGRNRVFPADINGDGYVDFVGISTAGEAYVYRNNQNNAFTAVQISNINFPTSMGWFSMNHNQRIWVADVNGDDRDDIVAIADDGFVHYALANTNGTIGSRVVSNRFTFPTAHDWFSTAHRERVWSAFANSDNKVDFVGIDIIGSIHSKIQ